MIKYQEGGHEGGRGAHISHGRLTTIDPRIPTMPGWSTSGRMEHAGSDGARRVGWSTSGRMEHVGLDGARRLFAGNGGLEMWILNGNLFAVRGRHN